MVETLTRADFEPHVGDDFAIGTGDAAILLELNEAKQLGTALRDGGAFALYFTGPPERPLPQAIYALRHDELGTLDIFIVPIARIAGGIRYEAIFT